MNGGEREMLRGDGAHVLVGAPGIEERKTSLVVRAELLSDVRRLPRDLHLLERREAERDGDLGPFACRRVRRLLELAIGLGERCETCATRARAARHHAAHLTRSA